MRTEKEILENVLEIAESDNGVRAVIRTSYLPKKENLFYFIVNDIEKYDDDTLYENSFGERILLFRGDKRYPDILKGAKGHLMVFKDGNTIVIDAMTLDNFMERYSNSEKENQSQKLLDKDNLLPEINDCDRRNLNDYKPSQDDYNNLCAEFFWVLKTNAEYIIRKELPAAMFYLNVSVRDVLNQMLRWHIEINNNFSVFCGVLDSYFETYLDKDMFELYRKTYTNAEYENIWTALYNTVELFHKAGVFVASYFRYTFPEKVEKAMIEFISKLRNDSI